MGLLVPPVQTVAKMAFAMTAQMALASAYAKLGLVELCAISA